MTVGGIPGGVDQGDVFPGGPAGQMDEFVVHPRRRQFGPVAAEKLFPPVRPVAVPPAQIVAGSQVAPPLVDGRPFLGHPARPEPVHQDKSRPSIDGRGSWPLLAANLSRYKELKENHQVDVGITYTVNKANHNDIYSDYLTIYRITGMPIGTLFVHEDNWKPQDFVTIRDHARLLHDRLAKDRTMSGLCARRRASNRTFPTICAAGGDSFAVNHRGDIYPCHRCYFSGPQDTLRLGNICSGLIPAQLALVREINSIGRLPARCRECPPGVWQRCHPCFAANHAAYGDFHRVAEAYCRLQHELHRFRQG